MIINIKDEDKQKKLIINHQLFLFHVLISKEQAMLLRP
jgi:hypothetical protein